MSTVGFRWQAVRWPMTWVRKVSFHHLSFVGGLALATGAAISMGALGDSPAQSVQVRSDGATAPAAERSTRWAVDHVVLYLIRSDTVVPAELFQAGEALGGVSQTLNYRLVETPEDERRLEEEMNDMFYNGVSYRVVDLRRSDATH